MLIQTIKIIARRTPSRNRKPEIPRRVGRARLVELVERHYDKVGMLLITGFLAIYTGKLFIESKNMRNETHENFITEHKPLVLLDRIDRINDSLYTFVFTNHGIFTAQIKGLVSMWAGYATRAYSSPDSTFDLEGFDDLAEMYLASNQPLPLPVYMEGFEMRDLINYNQQRDSYPYFSGRIYYQDVNSKRQYVYYFKIRYGSDVEHRNNFVFLVNRTEDYSPPGEASGSSIWLILKSFCL